MGIFRPRAGRTGIMPAFLRGVFGAIAPNTTTTLGLGGLHSRVEVDQLSVSARVVPVDADGALTMVISKYRAADDTVVPLTAAFDLEGLLASESTRIPMLIALSPGDRHLEAGDTLRAVVTSTSAAIDTAPADLIVVAELHLED